LIQRRVGVGEWGGFLRVGEPCNRSTSSELQVSIRKEIAAPDPFTMKIQQGKKTRVPGSSSDREVARRQIFDFRIDFGFFDGFDD
jgi:hypothetical protein